MSPTTPGHILRRLLPWAISAGALGYVFGYAIDWEAIPEATERANLPLFFFFTFLDKAAFFLVWGFLQAEVIRRFVEPVSMRSVFEVKGGSELLRTVNHSLADAAFLLGVAQLVRARVATVVIVATIPFGCHFLVLLLQATASLPFLAGGLAANRDVAIGVGVGWVVALGIFTASRLGLWQRAADASGIGSWWGRVRLIELAPFVGWFVLFTCFDVWVQGMASRAFGVEIDWLALASRIPLLYVALSLPSLGNFGTREIAWAQCFSEYAERETLVAYALWTNGAFLVLHVAIGILFLGRAVRLVRELRRARADGETVRPPLLHDAVDP
ncbi:MAG: hypothetical protein MJE66_08960 [Proteobacteria bacterium]|nr:hypothetical protein [Pseudomonadota bacterium]